MKHLIALLIFIFMPFIAESANRSADIPLYDIYSLENNKNNILRIRENFRNLAQTKQNLKSTYDDVYPESFGAKGDGVTDDTVAIQAAIDSIPGGRGGRVLLQEKSYLVKNIYLKERVVIEGVTRYMSRLTGSAPGYIVTYPAIGGETFCELKTLTINGRGIATGGVNINGNSNAWINDISVTNVSTGVWVNSGSYNCRINNIRMSNCWKGIYLTGDPNMCIIDKAIIGTMPYPIYTETDFNAETLKILNVEITANATSFITIQTINGFSGMQCIIDGARFDGHTSSACVVVGANAQCLMQNSVFASNSEHHINCAGINCIFENNFHMASSSAAIVLSGSSQYCRIKKPLWGGTAGRGVACYSKYSNSGTFNEIEENDGNSQLFEGGVTSTGTQTVSYTNIQSVTGGSSYNFSNTLRMTGDLKGIYNLMYPYTVAGDTPTITGDVYGFHNNVAMNYTNWKIDGNLYGIYTNLQVPAAVTGNTFSQVWANSGVKKASIDINGRFNSAETYTPTSSTDASGVVGDIAKDADYIYVKTSAGWKRSALSTW